MGLDIHDYKIVAVKLGYLYPKLAAAAPKAVLAFTSGSSCVAIEKLKFREISRPMFPIDANTVYTICLLYTSDILNALGRVIKEATGGKSLVSVFNAYHTEVYSAASGSFGARHLIDSPYIDCIAGPVSYEDRNEGGMGAYYTCLLYTSRCV